MKLSPSLLAADFGALRAEAKRVEALAASFHVDVMDGHFVPNLTIGPPVVNRFRHGVARPLDIHLMVEHPTRLAPAFDVKPGDAFIFHVEAVDDAASVAAALRFGTVLLVYGAHHFRVAVILRFRRRVGFRFVVGIVEEIQIGIDPLAVVRYTAVILYASGTFFGFRRSGGQTDILVGV